MTAGTAFLMWLGEQIDEYGIGNGISLLIMAGILARMPEAGIELLSPLAKTGLELGGSQPGQIDIVSLLVLAVLFVAVIVGVVFITQGQRRIPTQSAKHVRRPPRLRRFAPVSAFADQPIRRDAHHLRQQLIDVPPGHLSKHRQ